MKKLATSKEIKTYETYLTESGMISSILLMERAALSVYDELLKRGLSSSEEVWVVCGHGNNGADGLAIARLLSEKIPSEKIHITLLGDEDKATEEWHMQRSFLKKREIEAYPYPDHLPVAVPDLIIDAVLGIGSDRPLRSAYAECAQKINGFRKEGAYVVSVDIPSGLIPSSVKTDPAEELTVVSADLTVTFSALKPGMLLPLGRKYCGEIVVRSVADTRSLKTQGFSVEKKDLCGFVKRNPDGNKSMFGKVLSVSGSNGMAGAALLNVRAAFGAGAGMVTCLTVKEVIPTLLLMVPSVMTGEYENGSALTDDAIAWSDAVLIGCGLGKGENAQKTIRYMIEHADKPLVIDADGLNYLSLENFKDLLIERKKKGFKTILTPHPGEFARLFSDKEEISHQDPVVLMKLADTYGVILVAKDSRTIVCDESNYYINESGNDGMAVAGSGDVLAGMIASYAARYAKDSADHTLTEYVAAAVYLHGMAGDIAAGEYSKSSMTAREIISSLPGLLKQFEEGRG